jgi:uncharacterized protein YcnI
VLARRLLVPLAGAFALILAPLAGPAAAHVTVQGPGATQGGFTKLAFRTPTERPVATTKLEVAFPTDQPLARVSVRPKAGWTYQVTKAAPAQPFEAFGEPVEEVVTRIVWTAAAGNPGIEAGEFDEFEVSAGPLPQAERMVFKALQTYANGEVVRWIEEPVQGQDEPERPAPVLELAAAEEPLENTEPLEDAEPVAAAESTDDGMARSLGGAGLAAGLAGLTLGLIALLRTRRQPAATA